MTRAVLDEALRTHAASELADDGEVIVSWLALAAVRRHDGGGAVISLPSSGCMPYWEARGLLHEALASMDRQIAQDEAGDP
ncbi:MAG: hypothetical protein ACT4NY_09120 [Pseudonocardiales bacterium]